jgi:hypothetical protein
MADGARAHSGCLIGMDDQERRNRRAYGVAFGVVAFLGLYQGVVPLVVRLLFGRDQRFAPALRLPPPWWWITSIAVIVAAFALLVAIDQAKERPPP